MNVDYVRDLVSRFPRMHFGHLPTPLDEAARLSEALRGPRIYVKREDMTGLALGGNKPRALEFLLADARIHGADCIILSAAAQSNMVRMTAAAAAKLGMDVHPVLRSVSDNEPVQGNLLLDHLFGARVTLIPTKDPYSQLSVDVMSRIAEDLRRQGRTPYIIDLRYHSGPLAAMGYLLATTELEEQCEALNIRPSYMFAATGSGTTQAGLLLGSAILKSRYRVIGISVQKPFDWMLPRIRDKIAGAAALMGMEDPVVDEAILVDDRWIGQEYGVPSDKGIEAIKLVASKEGIVLDPIYSGKCMSGLIGWIREGRLTTRDTVVFIHTGGVPALFAMAQTIAPKLLDEQSNQRG